MIVDQRVLVADLYNGNQTPLADHQNDLVMHLLSISCNGQIITYGCNGQVFF